MANRFLLIGDWPQDAAPLYRRAFDVMGFDAQVELCGARTWRAAEVALLKDGCIGGVLPAEMSREAFEYIDVVAATSRITGGVSLVMRKSGKLLGLNTVGSGVVASMRYEGTSMSVPQASVLVPCFDEENVPDALSCVLAFAQAGVDSVALLGDNKDAAKATMQYFLDLLDRSSRATLMLSAAEEGERNLRQAYEDVTYGYGAGDNSSETIEASAIVFDVDDVHRHLAGRAAFDAQSVVAVLAPDSVVPLEQILAAIS